MATRSDIGWWWPWHFGAVSKHNPELVIHFKRTSDGQPWAPFWFEGRMIAAHLIVIKRSRRFLWQRKAIYVIPFVILLILTGLPIWMMVSAVYWPWWLYKGVRQAIRKRKAR